MSSLTSRLAKATGFSTLLLQPRSTYLLILTRSIRMFAYGATALFLVLFLSTLNVSDARIGFFMTFTLLGDVAISFLLTLFADGLGRRKILVFGSAMMVFSGIVFVWSENFWVLAGASVLGVISPSGNEIGPFRAIEESALAQLCPDKNDRADVFAWYNALASAGVAFGQLWCGWLVKTLEARGWSSIRVYKVLFAVYAGLGVVNVVLSMLLGRECELVRKEGGGGVDAVPLGTKGAEDSGEAGEHLLRDDAGDEEQEITTNSSHPPSPPPPPLTTPPKPTTLAKLTHLIPRITPTSQRTLLRLCALFAIDSFASGLITTSWISYYFNTTFTPSPSTLGTIFSTASIIAAISNLFAAALAKRIGLIQTMVFTHLPSAIFLALIPSTNVLAIAATFLLLRNCTSTMDAAPRQAFLSMAVLAEERTAVLGIVNVVKTMAQSAGPSVTGWLAGKGVFGWAFVVAGALKASYDLGMLKMFVGFRPPEDR